MDTSEPQETGRPKNKQHELFGMADVEISGASTIEISDQSREDLLHSLLALQSIKGIGFKTLCTLYDEGFIDGFSSWDPSRLLLEWSSIGIKREIDNIERELLQRDSLLEIGRSRAFELHDQSIEFIPRGHSHYPKNLERLDAAPRWLFAKGNSSLLHSQSVIAIVGTRTPSEAGRTLAYQTSRELVIRNFVVLSGLAKGIDQMAHQAAIDFFGLTIAVLGHGIASSFASVNLDLWAGIVDSDGVIISEYLPEDPPSRSSFLRRNELQAALSQVVIPIETPTLESGTGATIRRSKAVGTPVIGIIPNEFEEDALRITKQNLIENEIPVFEVLGQEESKLWAYLSERFPDHNWEIKDLDRQDRFIQYVEATIKRSSGRVSMDEGAIQRLFERLRRILLKQSDD